MPENISNIVITVLFAGIGVLTCKGDKLIEFK